MATARMTKRQLDRLAEIAAYEPEPHYPRAPYWNTPSDRALLSKGYIERADFDAGRGLTVYACRITDTGRAVIEAAP